MAEEGGEATPEYIAILVCIYFYFAAVIVAAAKVFVLLVDERSSGVVSRPSLDLCGRIRALEVSKSEDWFIPLPPNLVASAEYKYSPKQL